MRLWLIQKRQDLDPKDDPWGKEYDMYHALIIRAETEEDVRRMAERARGDEAPRGWLNPQYSTCEPLTDEGPATIVLGDFHAG